ncbi:MAG: DNA-processing protein DprA [Candidatus Eisenbacteria bacterium]
MPLAAGVAEAPRPHAHESARAIARDETRYPQGLRDLADAPARLWLAGGEPLPLARSVAIVGSRAASAYGRAFAQQLAADLASTGLSVVSGLARGIDSAAHAGALAAGGHTVAVVAAGLEQPVTDPALGARIVRSGALASEVAAGPPFGRGAFVRRNRLIAALAAVTVVVEASTRSGALSTAAAARALGRRVLAVPGDVDRPTALGPLQLLREGAGLCAGAADVLAALPATSPGRDAPARERLLAALDATPRSLEALAERAGLGAAEALAELVPLEWAGLAIACAGQCWRRG